MSATVKSRHSGVAVQCQIISLIGRAVANNCRLAAFGGGAAGTILSGDDVGIAVVITLLSASGRPGFGAAMACFSAAIVCRPAMPSTTRPNFAWKALTAASVRHRSDHRPGLA
jgi:hypothetical protein